MQSPHKSAKILPHFNITAIAKKLGVDRWTLGEWLSGKRPMPAGKLRDLAAFIKANPYPTADQVADRLLREAEKKEKPRRLTPIDKKWLARNDPDKDGVLPIV